VFRGAFQQLDSTPTYPTERFLFAEPQPAPPPKKCDRLFDGSPDSRTLFRDGAVLLFFTWWHPTPPVSVQTILLSLLLVIPPLISSIPFESIWEKQAFTSEQSHFVSHFSIPRSHLTKVNVRSKADPSSFLLPTPLVWRLSNFTLGPSRKEIFSFASKERLVYPCYIRRILAFLSFRTLRNFRLGPAPMMTLPQSHFRLFTSGSNPCLHMLIPPIADTRLLNRIG